MQPLSASGTCEGTPALTTGTLYVADKAHRVQIREISPTGAEIIAKEPISAQGDAVFRRGALFVAAYLLWSKGNEAGLRFYRELSPQEVDSILHPVVLRTAS